MTTFPQPRQGGWSEDRLAKLVELWSARLSAAQIALQLGENLTRSAVVGKLHRMGLTRDSAERRAARADGARQSRRKQRAVEVAQGRRPGPAPPAFATAPFPEAPACEVVPRLLPILALGGHACRWPYAGEEGTRFCGHAVQADSPYCAAHHRRAYTNRLPPLTPKQIEALAAVDGRAR